ncbi:MAG: hypothetical protein WC130_06395, partial [Kiritimatiellia bacterium]
MDTFSAKKRSWIMAQVKSTGNRSGMCRQLLKLDSFRFTFLCAFPLRSELFNDPFGVSRHPDYDR